MKSSVFCGITPCSPLKVSRRFGKTCRLYIQGRKISHARNQRESRWQAELVSCLANIEATCSSESSVDSHRTTRRYIPEDRTLHNHRYENLNSCTLYYVLPLTSEMLLLVLHFKTEGFNGSRTLLITVHCTSIFTPRD
jgi:hypothetical protein